MDTARQVDASRRRSHLRAARTRPGARRLISCRGFGAMPVALLLLGVVMMLDATAVAQTIVTPHMQVCMSADNGDKLNSNGCLCVSSNDCLGSCGGQAPLDQRACTNGPDVPACAARGSGNGVSSRGCSCSTDSDCRSGDCSPGIPATRVCQGGGEPPGPPYACPRPGVAGGEGRIGCPCDANADCLASTTCSSATRTCGGVVGAIAHRLPTIDAQALPSSIELGASAASEAIVLDAAPMPSTILFRAYGPDDGACATTRFTNGQPVAGMGLSGIAESLPFMPTAPGTWRFTASYQWNAWNVPVATFCGESTQRVEVADTRVFRDGFE